MTTDFNLLTFKAISSFTNDLCEIYGKDYHELKLYQRLLNKTTFSHDKAIRKHIETFRNFCISNREGILSKSLDSMKSDDKIAYSSRVYIDIVKIMKNSDKETVDVIWKHLLTISAFVDPAGKAKEILKRSSTKENKFIENIVNKVEGMNPHEKNPMEMLTTLLSSGALNEIATDLSNQQKEGNFDIGKLMGSVETLCSNLLPPTKDGESPLGNMMSAMAPLLANLTQGQNGGGNGGVDLDSMMKQIINSQASKTTVEEVKQDDVE